MDSDNTALALPRRAGGGFALWCVHRDEKPATVGVAPWSRDPRTPAAAAPAARPSPCALRLSRAELTAEGETVDIPGAVARCMANGRVDLRVTSDAPYAVYAGLTKALMQAGLYVVVRRNGGMTPRSRRRQGKRESSLAQFARVVRRVAEDVLPEPTVGGLARGRFGDKVFIAAIYRALADTSLRNIPRSTFHERLVDANRDGLLVLARADLAGAMDPEELEESEIRSLNSTFHFVVIDPPATGHTDFTLRIWPDGRKSCPTTRWYYTKHPMAEQRARERLIEGGIVDEHDEGAELRSGGWILSVDPADYRGRWEEPLP